MSEGCRRELERVEGEGGGSVADYTHATYVPSTMRVVAADGVPPPPVALECLARGAREHCATTIPLQPSPPRIAVRA